MTERGLLIVLSGPSGVGKDSVLDMFLPTSPKCVRSITATTRAKRENEEHGRDYFFLDREEFGELAARGEMLEYTEYNGNYYGTNKKDIQKILDSGKNAVLRIEVNGALNVKLLYPDAVLIFMAPPSWQALVERLEKRGTEKGEEFEGRLKTARYELSKAPEYDYIIINDDMERCRERLAAVVTAAECSAKHVKSFIEEVCKNA